MSDSDQITKADLADALLGIVPTHTAAQAAVSALLDTIALGLCQGQTVRLTGIGTLRPVWREGRSGVGPDGTQYASAGSRSVKLKVSQTLRDRLNPV